MKKSIMTAAVLSPLFIAVSAQAGENVPDRYGYIGGHVSEYFFYDNQVTGDVDGLDDSAFPGGQIGWRFSPKWSVQAWYEKNDDVDHKYTDRESEVIDYYASLRHHFDGTSFLGFEPYTGINAGVQEVNDNDETLAGVELGIQRALFKHVLLDLGTRHAYSLDREFWQGQVYAGLNLMFAVSGREGENARREADDQPEEVISMADSDNDGVPDDRDDCPGTAPNARVDANGCQIYKMVNEQTIKTIYFEFDQSDVRGQFSDEVRDAAQQSREGAKGQIRIEGHTDSIGSEQYNQGLSERRADSVKKQLIEEYRIDPDKVETRGYGESRPVAPNDTAEGREKNRRADIIVEGENKEPQFKE
ncbi:OmpA family protein [Alloalcanivorax marinus]|uniref:OmpA family protein n=1 Tax=Alloalcanivorax marinus TaxID=1177169 RepID=UPI0019335D49|nr:OmpA family protein [Alloalcanivorax marinus]MBL7250054.1 OmpA family protein [Alloalcanivorax marinus]